MSAADATLMSFTNLTSAGQFAALSIIAASSLYTEMALTQLIINLRYSLMSCALSQRLSQDIPLFHRFIMAFGITDEIFAVSLSYPQKLSPFYTYGLMSVAIPGWTIGTLLGALIGGVLPARILSAFGVALYGMFISAVVPAAKKNRVVFGLVLVSMATSAAIEYIPLFSFITSGARIILLTIILCTAAALIFPVKEDANAGG